MKLLLLTLVFAYSCNVLSSSGAVERMLEHTADQAIPRTVDTLWEDYDPRAEPLDVEVLHTWEQDGVVMQVLRYRVGILKGTKTMMAAVYGYPKGESHLPGLVQIHGGGQYADYRAVLTNAKRGYATLSIAWAGRINAPDYVVNPQVLQLFFDGKTEDPDYKLTTDWGTLEGYHAPGRYKSGNVHDLEPAEWTIDAVVSPRNSAWYLWTMGARRGLTFLEQRDEVDGNRLGVYGHSMGGKLTVLTAGSDSRVKAAAPSCGGLSNRMDNTDLYNATIGDDAYLKRITCPIFFLSPSNDFHGLINHVPLAVDEIQTQEWRVNSSPHQSHKDTASFAVATQLWMDRHLKEKKPLLETPEARIELSTESGVPQLKINPDMSNPILSIEVYYTQQGQEVDEGYDRERTINRYWHYAPVQQNGDSWVANLPVWSVDEPLWAYANVTYALDEPVSGAGYYYGDYTAHDYVLSSLLEIATPAEIKDAQVAETLESTTLIEDFKGEWRQGWFHDSNDPDHWQVNTHKVYDPMYLAPEYAKLAVEVQVDEPNILVIGLNQAAAEVALVGGAAWQKIVLYPTDFKTADGDFGLDWSNIFELRLGDFERLRSSLGNDDLIVGKREWQGSNPRFRNLQWISGTRAELNERRTNKLLKLPVEAGKTYLTIDAADQFTDGYQSAMDMWLDGEPLTINGVHYERGVTTHAPSKATYFLNGVFSRLEVVAAAGASASVEFEVYLDGQCETDTIRLDAGQSQALSVDVEGVSELQFVVTDGGNGKGGDHASWVNAYLVR